MAHTLHNLRAVTLPTTRHTPHAHQKENDYSLRVLVKRIGAKPFVLELPPHSSIRDLRSNLCTDSKSAEMTIIVSGQHVTDLDQPLHAYGLEGSKCLLLVSESDDQKLKGGMVCLPPCLPSRLPARPPCRCVCVCVCVCARARA